MPIELYLPPHRYEELREYLRACTVVFRVLDSDLSESQMDDSEGYENSFKAELRDESGAPAFDDSTDSGDCELIESAFGLIGGAVELEGYDANGVKIIWTIVPIPVGWYAPGVAP